MLLHLAWRNIWRTRGKTAITLILLTLSTIVLVVFISLITGTINKVFDDAMDIYPGNIHIDNPKYDQEPSYDYLLTHVNDLKEKLSHEKNFQALTLRMESFFLFSSQENSYGGLLSGIEPETEKKTTLLHTTLTQGRFINHDDTNEIVMGETLAKKLHIKVGDTLSIMGNAIDYSFAADNLKLVGIFHSAVPKLDANLALINKPYLDKLIGSYDMATRIIITPKKRDDSMLIAQQLNHKYGSKDMEVVDWHTHMSAMIEGLELIRISRYMLIYFFIAIIFAVITIFALLMLLGRQKEIGVMRAMGTTPWQIVGIILMERFILTLISLAIGLTIAGFLAHYFELHPIFIKGGDEMVQRIGAMEFVLKSHFLWATIVQGGLTILGLSLLTVIYPIWHIGQQKPVDAIHSL